MSPERQLAEEPGVIMMTIGTKVEARILGKATVTIDERESLNGFDRWTPPFPSDDAMLLSVQLRDVHAHRVSEDGVMAEERGISAGSTLFYDLRRIITQRCGGSPIEARNAREK
jgi:hypothetical protein